MNELLQKIRTDAMALPLADRRALIHELVDSLNQQEALSDAAWEEEVARRIKEIEDGKVDPESQTQIIGKAHSALSK